MVERDYEVATKKWGKIAVRAVDEKSAKKAAWKFLRAQKSWTRLYCHSPFPAFCAFCVTEVKVFQ